MKKKFKKYLAGIIIDTLQPSLYYYFRYRTLDFYLGIDSNLIFGTEISTRTTILDNLNLTPLQYII